MLEINTLYIKTSKAIKLFLTTSTQVLLLYKYFIIFIKTKSLFSVAKKLKMYVPNIIQENINGIFLDGLIKYTVILMDITNMNSIFQILKYIC